MSQTPGPSLKDFFGFIKLGFLGGGSIGLLVCLATRPSAWEPTCLASAVGGGVAALLVGLLIGGLRRLGPTGEAAAKAIGCVFFVPLFGALVIVLIMYLCLKAGAGP
jgi:hypothetical protein